MRVLHCANQTHVNQTHVQVHVNQTGENRTRVEEHRQSPRRRSGLATVELALCLPVAIGLVLGMIEASNAIFTKQSLKIAAYESARIASSSTATEGQAIARAQEVLASRKLTKARVKVTPKVTSRTPRGTPVTVSIELDTEDASYGAAWFGKDARFAVSVRMVRL